MSPTKIPYRYETCEECGKKFRDSKTADQRLLAAIFGEKHLCPSCYKDKMWSKCAECGKPIEDPIHFNDEPFHSYCLLYTR